MNELAVRLLDLLPLALLGAVLGLDVVSFPQAMLSRPIVAATLSGMLLGQPMQGLLLGVTLELFALETLPFGASRYPEWACASVVGGALLATYGSRNAAGAFTVALMASLVVAWVGGQSMVWLRRLNARWARERLAAIDHGSGRTVVSLQLMGMSADLLRGFLLTGISLVVLTPVAGLVLDAWGRSDEGARAVAVGLGAMVATAAAWRLFRSVARARLLFLAGGAIGVLALWVRS